MVDLFLIGPSGVGKSTVARHLSACLPVGCVIDIDRVLPDAIDDWDQVGRLLEPEQPLAHPLRLFAVGAGTQTSLHRELLNHWQRAGTIVVALMAPAEEVARREPLRTVRSLERFRRDEYSITRSHLYSRADFIIDVAGLTRPDVAIKIWELIYGLDLEAGAARLFPT